jgi:hypothetical protein
MFRDKVQIPRTECLTAFEEEFGLGGIGELLVGHWDEAIEDGNPGESQKGYILYTRMHAVGH